MHTKSPGDKQHPRAGLPLAGLGGLRQTGNIKIIEINDDTEHKNESMMTANKNYMYAVTVNFQVLEFNTSWLTTNMHSTVTYTTRQDKIRQDQTKQDKTRLDKTRS